MLLLSHLERYQQITERALQAEMAYLLEVSPRLMEAIRYSLFGGGKRMRPILALASCEAVCGQLEDALPVAVALEMIHTYSLIHDDLPAMDNDDFRRGRPTNHKVYGDALAVLAGDGLLTEAFHSLSRSEWKISSQRRTDIIGVIALAAGAEGMVAGQALDTEYEGKVFDETILVRIHSHKTGKLLKASVVAGGIAGGANESELECLQSYGKNMGLAFQIADDILDLTGTTKELGKDAKSDLKKNKATYPALLGLEESRRKAQELLKESLLSLEPLGDRADVLRQLAYYIVERRA